MAYPFPKDGGGYGVGHGDDDIALLMGANDDGFVGVSIQYRVR